MQLHEIHVTSSNFHLFTWILVLISWISVSKNFLFTKEVTKKLISRNILLVEVIHSFQVKRSLIISFCFREIKSDI